eukprot:SAG31_NODE_18809_length_622_cov_0.778203_1_plen_31_part_10
MVRPDCKHCLVICGHRMCSHDGVDSTLYILY